MLNQKEIMEDIQELCMEIRQDTSGTLRQKTEDAVRYNMAYLLAKSGQYQVFTGTSAGMEAHFASVISGFRITEEFYLLDSMGVHAYGFFEDMLYVWVNTGPTYFCIDSAAINKAWKIRLRKRRLDAVLAYRTLLAAG